MLHRFFITISSVFILCTSAAAQTMAQRIDALLDDNIFVDSDASVAIYDLDDDTLLYEYRAQKLCRPASVTKVITATVALSRLGCDYTVDTHLWSDENASGGKNIYVQGSIDPLFSEDDLMSLVAQFASGTHIDTLFADCSFMDSIYWGPGWSWDDTPWEFQPYISPLMLCGGTVQVTVKPSVRGEAPTVECYPQSNYYTIVNEAVTQGGRGEKLTILRDWLDGTNVIRIKGDCNKAKSEKMNLLPSQDYFMKVFSERLDSAGVSVGTVAYTPVPQSAQLLYSVQRPIADITGEALMESNNLCAEALSYHLGALYGERPVRQEMGPKIMKGFLDFKIDAPERYHIADGSGLSLYTYLSADIILQTLRLAYNDKKVYETILASLPLSGISGTMKNRTKNSAAYKKVYAKTGTVKGVCTLAGYARAANGHTLAFVILNQGSMSASTVRRWQDKVCDVLCR